MKQVSFEIQHKAISINHVYGMRRVGKFCIKYVTPKGKEFKRFVEVAAEPVRPRDLYTGDISMEIIYHFKDKRKHDIDNYSKHILDALSGLIYVDDKQVTDLRLQKIQPSERDYIEVIVMEMPNKQKV